jgi:hypothetical protein
MSAGIHFDDAFDVLVEGLILVFKALDDSNPKAVRRNAEYSDIIITKYIV